MTADALREAAAVGARAALVCAGGFAEAGGDGALHQQALAEVVRDTGIRVLGPNTSGFLAPHDGSRPVSYRVRPTWNRVRWRSWPRAAA